jgi:histidinol phosphatase-like PHP family hydrolase
VRGYRLPLLEAPHPRLGFARPMLTNAQLAELLARAAESELRGTNRERALARASRAAFFWPIEASDLIEQDRPLTELRSVGPWLAGIILGWLRDPELEPPDPPALRQGFLTMSEVRRTVDAHPDWVGALRADLQMHTTWSDGRAPLREVVAEAGSLWNYEYIAITDHSKGLKIARGMDEAQLARQGEEIDAINRELAERASGPRVLRSIEMNLTPEGTQDMEPDALARLDLVLAAFHSRLRQTEDQTERYLLALRNPTFHVLAHPRGRMFNRRLGLRADWPRVFQAAENEGKALEIDAHPSRQDLDSELLKAAREAGVWISIGTDAHRLQELRYVEFGVALAIRSGFPRDRILNYQTPEFVHRWVRDRPTRQL